jgi:hypothetical protein
MSEIEIIPLVTINAIKTKIEGINNEKLVDEIRSSREDVDKKYWENQHHTYYEDKRYPYGKPEAEKLLKLLSEKVNSIVGKKLVLSEAWTLTLEEGQSVAAHSHKSNQAVHQEEYYSIAYYPSAPNDSADLIFMVTACNTIESSVIVAPKQGDLVIFNSYIMHMTNRHRNKNEERIVISANFIPEIPNNEPNQDWTAYARQSEPQQNKPVAHQYELVISTVFGDEAVNLVLYEDGTGLANNHSSQMSIPTWSVSGGITRLDFRASVPIDADVNLTISENGYGQLFGSLKIGEYAVHKVQGQRVK